MPRTLGASGPAVSPLGLGLAALVYRGSGAVSVENSSFNAVS